MRTFPLFTILLLAACATVEAPVYMDVGDTSRNAIAWPGTYTGLLPCADCEGIRTTVTLNDDGTFVCERIYLGKSDAPVRDAGRFAWNRAGSAVTLVFRDGSTQQYQVGEEILFHLDRDGNRIGGDLADRYVLRQSLRDPRLEDRRWILVEDMGQPFGPPNRGLPAFIMFDSGSGRASGHSSCNNFIGSYVIEAGQRLRFAGNMGATMMACPDMSVESAFINALRRADNYAVNGDQLSLNRARMAPLLRFELAKAR